MTSLDLGDIVWDLLQWIETEVGKLTYDGEAAFKEIQIEEKGKIENYPVCRISHTRNDITELTGTKDWHEMYFVCSCGNRNQDFEAGMKDIINRAAEIYNMIPDHRRMDGKVHDAHVTEFNYEWEPQRKISEQWVHVTIRARKHIQ